MEYAHGSFAKFITLIIHSRQSNGGFQIIGNRLNETGRGIRLY